MVPKIARHPTESWLSRLAVSPLYTYDAITDAPLLGNEVTTGGEPDKSCSDATLEAVNVIPQQTPQTSRRDSNAMGLVISDSISLQGSLKL